MSTNVLDINYETNFIFAYEVPRDALNTQNIPSLTEEELKSVKTETQKDDEFGTYEETKVD